MNSRYYDPEIGRFLNADAFASTGQGIIGNNMFAYCGNNPVHNVDSSGTRYEISAGGGGAFTNPRPTPSLWQLVKNVILNEDPQEALDDDIINFYKGVPVVKTPGMDNASFSFGTIFMGNVVKEPNLLYHEYGHVEQLKELGVLGYTQFVVIPSVACFWATDAGLIPGEYYYNLPWENIADRYGNVTRSYIDGAMNLADCYWTIAKIGSFIEQLLIP